VGLDGHRHADLELLDGMPGSRGPADLRENVGQCTFVAE
jgi:hypothetical protein